MAFLNWLGNAPVHDPIYGIDHANITKELTGSNWQMKAIVRDGLYIWVVRGYRSDGDKRIYRYYVRLHLVEHKALKKDFASRDRALAYANALGSNEGEYPPERSPVTYMTLRRGPSRGAITREMPINGGLKQ
jgi:hypothetical protein